MVLTHPGALGKSIAEARWMPETTLRLQTSKDPNACDSRQDCGRWEVAMFWFVFNFKIRFIQKSTDFLIDDVNPKSSAC